VTARAAPTGLHADPIFSSMLSTPAPPVEATEAVDIARRYFGLDTSAHRLASERDSMFRLRDAGGVEYLLKITNPAEPPEVTHLQTAALRWIAETDPQLPVQRVHKTRDGKTELRLTIGGDVPRTVRLLGFLQGKPLHETPRTQAQRRELGRTLARMALALTAFGHPSADHQLAWDISHADRLRPLITHVHGHEERGLVKAVLDRFEAAIKPRLSTLRAQVVHNDLNLHNVLVDPDDADTITGVIDFGDVVRTRLINDVAIGAAYHLSTSSDVLEGPREFIDAYQEITPLAPEETELLPDLIATRLLATVLITGWRAERYPENRDYILKNNALAWDGLDRLAHITPEVAQRSLRASTR
jgi:Ser/Thr protein kinase RdoA (MazF antagonist)